LSEIVKAYKKFAKSRNYTYDLMMKNQGKFISLIGLFLSGKEHPNLYEMGVLHYV